MDALSLLAVVATPVVVLGASAMVRRHGYRTPLSIVVPGSLLVALGVAVALCVLSISSAITAAIVLAFATGLGVVHATDRPGGEWAHLLRSRLLLGVPWGTLVSIAIVLAVYLFLQRGIEHPYDPLALPFTSWSYLYPLGVVTAPFSHASLGHVTGNLIGTVALAPLAEYAWSHFPTRRGTSSFASWRTNPYVRAFVLFPLGVLLVGLGTSVFAWGAVIGFSGVVFAFAGFAVVRYPLATVIALAARSLISTVYYALRDPVVVAAAGPSYGPPWWAGIAIQGHLLGLFLGALLGALVVGRRRERPSAGRVFAGVVLLGFSLALYALWWYRGPSAYVLYRGLGVVLIVTLGVLFATTVASHAREIAGGVTRRQVALAVMVLPIITMGMVAVPINLSTVSHVDPPEDAIQVRDYTVYYAEDVTNRRISVVDVSVLNESTAIDASGVIVTSDTRHLWTEAVSTGALAFWGEQSVHVGGVGWEAIISVKRRGWEVVGADAVYNVFLRPPDGEYTAVFASSPSTAAPVIAGRNVTLVAVNGTFRVRVTAHNRTLGAAPLPATNESVTIAGLTLARTNDTLRAIYNETRVTVATKETYE